MIIQDPKIRERVKQIAQELIGGYEPGFRDDQFLRSIIANIF
jgi:hypothetical protein